MKRLTRRLARLAMAVLFAAALAVAFGSLERNDDALATEGSGTDTYATILGDAVNYGVVAESYVVQTDAQTNVAAVVGSSRTQTGNDLTNAVEQPFILANVTDVFNIKGLDAYVRTNATDASKVVGLGGTVLTIDTSMGADQLAAEVREMIGHVARQSALLASRAPTADVVYDAAAQKYLLDVRGRGSGTYYVDVDASTYAAISAEPSKLRIYKDAGQVVVLNVAGETLAAHKFDLNGRGSDAFLGGDAGDVPQTIVWNFHQATTLAIAGSMTGVVLAPKAAVSVDATSSGWLVARDVVVASGEWHNVYQGVEQLREGSTASFAARKLVDGVAAEVNGFSFELALKAASGYRPVATAVNEGASVAFGEQAYDETNYTAVGDTQEFVYRVAERQGAVDDQGTQYVPDERSFFARVVVTRMTQRLPGTTKTVYAASGPTYYLDEGLSVALDGLPAFDNATASGEPASVTPAVTKVMEGAALVAGEFEFALRDASGALVQTATNDADGAVAFQPLLFARPGSHAYLISEHEGDDEAVIYDDATIRYVVEVANASDGSLVATGTYYDEDGAVLDAPSFVNRMRELVVRARKTSLDEPDLLLAGATYGLWQVGDDGADVRVDAQTSAADGSMVFELPTTDDATYYLLEEEAPYGYLVDPHPTDRFFVSEDDEGFYLRHADDPELVRAVVESDDGPLTLEYAPTTNAVADHAIAMDVEKLDRQTGARLAGATLRVLDKETGEVMAEWESGDDPYALSDVLDTERTYVLREVRAPQGYDVAADVEFVVHAEGVQTTGSLLAGRTTAAGQANARMETTDAGTLRLSLLDGTSPVDAPTSGLGAGTPSAASPATTTRGAGLPKTGDPAHALFVALAAALGATVLALGLGARGVARRSRR